MDTDRTDEPTVSPRSRPVQYAKAIALILALYGGFYGLAHLLPGNNSEASIRSQSAVTEPRSPVPGAPVPTASGTAAAPPESTWVRQEFTSEIDDSKSLTYGIAATGDLEGWLNTKRPILMARCSKHQLDAIVVTQMPASVEYGDRTGHRIRVRFDEGPISNQRWTESTTNDGLFAPNGESFLASVAKSKRLRIELTPFNSTPKVVDFRVEGFSAPYAELLQTCGAAAHHAGAKHE